MSHISRFHLSPLGKAAIAARAAQIRETLANRRRQRAFEDSAHSAFLDAVSTPAPAPMPLPEVTEFGADDGVTDWLAKCPACGIEDTLLVTGEELVDGRVMWTCNHCGNMAPESVWTTRRAA